MIRNWAEIIKVQEKNFDDCVKNLENSTAIFYEICNLKSFVVLTLESS